MGPRWRDQRGQDGQDSFAGTIHPESKQAGFNSRLAGIPMISEKPIDGRSLKPLYSWENQRSGAISFRIDLRAEGTDDWPSTNDARLEGEVLASDNTHACEGAATAPSVPFDCNHGTFGVGRDSSQPVFAAVF